MKHFQKIGFRDMKQAVIFDIESASIEPELKEGSPLHESWAYKQRHEGELTFEQLNDKFKKEAPLYGFSGRIVTICMGYVKEGKLSTKCYSDENEGQLVQKFFKDLDSLTVLGKKTHLVSFSGVGYDMPFVHFRSLVNGVKIHRMFDVAHQKEWNLDYSIDMNLYLRGTSFSNLSLLNAAVAFGLPSPKQSLCGDEVSKLYWSKDKKRIEKIENYCTQDVLTTANLLCKVMGAPILELNQ